MCYNSLSLFESKIFFPSTQSSADKKSRRVGNKLISPLHSQIAGLSEAEKVDDKASPLDIPYIVLNVTEKDYMNIISSSLPPLDEV